MSRVSRCCPQTGFEEVGWIGTLKSASVYQRTCSGNRKFWTSDELCGSNLAVCFTPVAAQFTAFDGVIIAASMSSCAARRSSLML